MGQKKYQKSLLIIIGDFLNSCEKQYKELEQFCTQKGYLHGEGYEVKLVSNYALNYLAKLDYTTFINNFASITKKKRARDISQLLAIIEQVRLANEKTQKIIDFTYSKYSDYLNVYIENLENLRKINDRLQIDWNGKEVRTDFGEYLTFIANTFKEWKSNGGIKDLAVVLIQIINPLYYRSIAVAPTDLSYNITNHTLECKSAIENIQAVENLMYTQIKETIQMNKNAFLKGTKILDGWNKPKWYRKLI